ncbi:MAG TPA: SufS family cysteine desulfurase [Caulifigura sp.]|nr:SufS family cysteine desulfurase [Caulifigura sp.]
MSATTRDQRREPEAGGDSFRRLDAEAVRRDFPIFAARSEDGRPLTFLDTGASAQKPQVVIDRESFCYSRSYANAYRGVYQLGAEVDDAIERTRESVRSLLNAASQEEIIFTAGTTASINLVAQGWGRKFLKPGDEILLSVLEHHANIVPWQMAAQATGAVIKWIPLTPDGRLDLSTLDQLLTRRTKIVAVTGMSNVLGTIPPVAELARAAHAVGAKILVDGAQSVPHAPVDVRADDIDFLTFSGHKLYGPTGVGVLYAKAELLDAMDPMFGGGHMIATVSTKSSTWATAPAKFEAGTLPIAQIIALEPAIEYVRSLGWDAIHSHEVELLGQTHERLSAIDGLRILGPAPQHKGAIVSFVMDGISAQDVAVLLDVRGVCVRHGHHCTMPLHEWLDVPASVRASFGVYNTLDDVERLAKGLESVRKRLSR